MIREAIEKVSELVRKQLPVYQEIEGRGYTVHQGGITPLLPPMPPNINAVTLTAVVDFMTEIGAGMYHEKPVMVQVASPTEVLVRSAMLEPWKNRPILLTAEAVTESFTFDRFMDVEQYIISVQAKFVMTANALAMIRLVSSAAADHNVTTDDDGVSQKVVVKKTVTTKGEETVPNPITLRPFRTFLEVEQPESDYVFRLQNGGNGITAALFTANGGQWKLQAIDAIREYLAGAIKAAGFQGVTIIA